MIQIETQCPNCPHALADHLEALPSERRPDLRYYACLVCGCRHYVGGRRDEIGEHKARREVDDGS